MHLPCQSTRACSRGCSHPTFVRTWHLRPSFKCTQGTPHLSSEAMRRCPFKKLNGRGVHLSVRACIRLERQRRPTSAQAAPPASPIVHQVFGNRAKNDVTHTQRRTPRTWRSPGPPPLPCPSNRGPGRCKAPMELKAKLELEPTDGHVCCSSNLFVMFRTRVPRHVRFIKTWMSL